ncbi:Outer membrane protein, OmpA/MotB [Candidatus Magnetoovum chiemensis]|nr:Outer membrane protein, OmpA/MotB [Candidatus Magnetoovum chiemensis]
MKHLPEEFSDNPFALSIGDLMAALLLIFALLLSLTLLQLQIELKKQTKTAQDYKEIAEKYKLLQEDLYKDLYEEFKNDLEKWSAILEKSTLTIRFQEPDVLFEVNESVIKEKFKLILDDFFPRYVKLLYQPKYKDNIEEIRIEGHTSSEWSEANEDPETAYFENMRLSQDRTRSVLHYAIGALQQNDEREWTRSKITANGLSSSKLIYDDSGAENKNQSRRVEFRVRTNAEEKIREMLKVSFGKQE